ncbi:MAG: hypothetical protein RIR12_293 [Bacteroidota bacterium]|jgi:hypothetical protein
MKIAFLFITVFYSNFSIAQKALHIYGGQSHEVYLGCINCDDYNTNSVWNEYSKYGNNYNVISIWNEYGTYGNEYSQFSPWNEYGSYPPVIVDKEGNFYGYFTINEYKAKRWESKLALTIYKYYEEIMEDVSAWYEKIFG